jgi:hypothetical protein
MKFKCKTETCKSGAGLGCDGLLPIGVNLAGHVNEKSNI